MGRELDGQRLSFPAAFPAVFGDRAKGLPAADTRKNPFVERYHRNYKYECQYRATPGSRHTIATNAPYVHFYNFERPNQAITCGNQPPRVKFPRPPELSPVPDIIDPDRWLVLQTGKTYTRRLDRNGTFQLGNQTYYVQQKLHGRSVTIWVDGRKKELGIFVGRQAFKKIPIKGLQNRLMNFSDYLELMCQEAISTWRRLFGAPPPIVGLRCE